jgi:ABC-2 type transport system ATP-binding protein
VDSLTDTTLQTLRSVPGVDEVVGGGHEVTVHADNGAAVMSPVALALHDAGTAVVSLTLRTPTLDDVFLQLTGSHLQGDASADGAGQGHERSDRDADPEAAAEGALA